MTEPAAGAGTSSALISVAQLAEGLGLASGSRPDPRGVVVVDCRFNLMKPEAGRAAWTAGHIPGAFYADLDRDLAGPLSPASGRHPLPDPEQLRVLFARFGIGPQSLVVAYDEGPGAIAARLWWLLRWMGHERVALLDGGLAAWERAGLPLSTAAPAPGTGRFVGEPGAMPTVDTGLLAAAVGSAGSRLRLLDARAPDRFAGTTEPIDPVAGHVPGAVNAPFTGNLGSDGRFLPARELAGRFAGLAAGRSPAELVCMCGSGVTACHNLFALELAGLTGAALYPGSWSEWIRSPDRPVARGP